MPEDAPLEPTNIPLPSLNPFGIGFEMTPMLELPRRDGTTVGVPISRVIVVDGQNVFAYNQEGGVSILSSVLPPHEIIAEYNRLWSLARPNQSGDFMERIGSSLLKKLNQGDEWKPE